ncbi:unnamed protein product [Candidula unifasciata]|uniref:Thyrotropin-releasing hormone receptor n=1 Tax=Candidula unifasciata TaxID=100452 RepID=A0A8S4A2V4_9EUPU|nr:unnamed protein product [Candidula unifasciata]
MSKIPCFSPHCYKTIGSQFDFLNDNITEIMFVNVSASGGKGQPVSNSQVYYSTLFAVVAVSLSSVIFIFGILGNILVVIVIARTRSMHTPTNCYLLSLAVADSLVLLSATLPAIPEPFFRIDEWPYGRVLCSLLIFLQYLGIDTSSLSITAFTIERYIAICHPMKAQIMCTVSRAKKIIAALWTFTILYCSPWLGLTVITESRYHNRTPIEKCQFRLARSSYLAFFLFDLVLMYFIPLLVATVLYLLIGRILYLSRNLRRIQKVTANRGLLKHRVTSGADSRTQVVRMLVVVVVTFASLWMPYRVMVVYNSFAQKKYMDLWFLLFARTMVYVNCAINPVLYNIMSVKFKRAFQKYLTCWRRKSRAPSQHTSETPADFLANKRSRFRHADSSKQLGSGSGSSNNTREILQHFEDIQILPLPSTRMQFYDSCVTAEARSLCRNGCREPSVDEQAV